MGEGSYVGVALDTPKGYNDGSSDGRRYFTCSQNHSVFMKLDRVRVASIFMIVLDACLR
jgi:dynactin complex subunit